MVTDMNGPTCDGGKHDRCWEVFSHLETQKRTQILTSQATLHDQGLSLTLERDNPQNQDNEPTHERSERHDHMDHGHEETGQSGWLEYGYAGRHNVCTHFTLWFIRAYNDFFLMNFSSSSRLSATSCWARFSQPKSLTIRRTFITWHIQCLSVCERQCTHSQRQVECESPSARL